MKGFILAGGTGTRLLPLTRRVPRWLVPIQDRPVIYRSILLLKSAGILDIVVNTHHLAKRVSEALGDGEALGVRITYSHESELRGIGAAIKNAQPLLDGDTFVVINGDVVVDIDLSGVVSYHRDQKADATLVLRPDATARTHGPLDFDDQISLSTLIGESPDESGFLQPAGIRVFDPRVFTYLQGGHQTLAETLAFMVKQGCRIEGYITDGYWADLRTWERYGHILWEIGRGFVPDAPT